MDTPWYGNIFSLNFSMDYREFFCEIKTDNFIVSVRDIVTFDFSD